MKIIVDENMPYAEELFSQLGEVILKPGRTLTADDLVDVDALMIRSVTKVNAELISKANKLKFVGTATAGMDHVDQTLMQEKGISSPLRQVVTKLRCRVCVQRHDGASATTRLLSFR